MNTALFSRFSFVVVVLTLFCVSCSRDGFEEDYPVPELSITKVALSEEQQGYMTAGNQFSLDLMNLLYKGNNLVVSPLSVQMALGMSLNGADGSTAEEIIGTLGYGTDKEKDINEYCKSLLEQLPSLDKSVKLKIMDAVVVDSGYSLKDSYKNSLRKYYYAPAESYSLRSPEALDRINDWAKRNTEGQIDPFLDNLPDNVAALVLNSVYFKARWQYSIFEYESSENREFLLENGTTTELSFLRTHAELGYADTDDLQILELPYADGAFSMYILLPMDPSAGSCQKLLASLTEKSLKALTRSVAKQYVSVFLPEFDVTTSLGFKETLQAMGINKAFDADEADFSRMHNKTHQTGNLYIHDVLQKTRIKVTKRGTEAASATAIEYGDPTDAMFDDTGALIVDANHPFIFCIAEKNTGVILFEGVFAARDGE